MYINKLNLHLQQFGGGVIEPFFPPEKWLGGKTTIGALQSHVSPIASFSSRKNGYIVGFPPGRMAIQWDSPPEEWLYSRIPPERMTTQQSPSENGLNIFNLIALLNFTTTCQCHFRSTISVDGFTSQVACTWMIQMTLNGKKQGI